MAITINNFSFARNRQMNLKSGLKSTREKIARQEKCEDQVNFWENQKKNLKNWEGATLEDIARKLEMFHSYEDQIDAAKMVYNNEQMWHMMDEARERAEKLAEHLEETKPKTPEERKEDLVEEALGVDENKGMLSEILDSASEMIEDIESIEEVEQAAEMAEKEKSLEEISAEEVSAEEMSAEVIPTEKMALAETVLEETPVEAMETEAYRMRTQNEEINEQKARAGLYKRFDMRI